MKVSLVGWNCHTGLGTMNRQIATADWCHKWYVPLHPRLGVTSAEDCKAEYRVGMVNARCSDVDWLLDGTDVLLFVEVPYLASHRYLADARARGIRVVCIPMVECFYKGLPWLHLVDQVIVPNEYAKGRVHGVGWSDGYCWAYDIKVCRWGIDLAKFEYVERQQANRFLFCNGFGGVHGRKGLEFIDQLAALCPEIHFVVRSQTPNVGDIQRHQNVEVRGPCDNQNELYRDGDVLLSPSKFEGLGFQAMEAMACGLPTVVSGHPPMSEGFPTWTIPCDQSAQRVGGNRFLEAKPRIDDFAALVRSIHGKDISAESKAARKTAEAQFDVRQSLARLESQLAAGLVNNAGKL